MSVGRFNHVCFFLTDFMQLNLQSELVNVGVAYCHSVEERCTLDLDSGTNYYQAAAVGKGRGQVSPVKA